MTSANRRRTRFWLVGVIAAAAWALSATPAWAVGITWSPNGDYFGAVTNAGVYYIGVRCFTEAPTPRPTDSTNPAQSAADLGNWGNDVGPGYIFAAAAVDPDGAWRTKTRDYIDVSQSDPRNGGWSKFGAHVARFGTYAEMRNATQHVEVKEVQAGICAGHETKDPFYGAGVTRAQVVAGPNVSGGDVVFTIDVYLSDGVSEILRVRYDYRINDSYVRLWTGVQQLCNEGNGCGARVYVKEPKFTADDYVANPNDGSVDTVTPYRYILGVAPNPFTGGWEYACTDGFGNYYNYRVDATTANPRGGTLQCAPAKYSWTQDKWRYRQQIWMKQADTGSIATDCWRRCTWISAYGATGGPGSTITNWTAAGTGLDKWAVDEYARDPYQSRYETNHSYCSIEMTNMQDKRHWEIGGWSAAAGSPDGTNTLQVGFHGWVGGSGAHDCYNLARAMSSSAVTYSNYFEYWFR